MSQSLYCSATDCGAEADVIIGDTRTGDQTPLCGEHLLAWCFALIESVADAEADETAAEVESKMAGVHPPAGSDQEPDAETAPDLYAQAVTAGYLTPGEAAIGQAIGFDLDASHPPFPATRKTVRSTHGHRKPAAKGRRAARAAQVAPEAAPDGIVVPGAPEAAIEDPDVNWSVDPDDEP